MGEALAALHRRCLRVRYLGSYQRSAAPGGNGVAGGSPANGSATAAPASPEPRDGYDPARFAALRHFVLPFQDGTFECVAEGYRVETTNEPLSRVVEQLAARLFDRYR